MSALVTLRQVHADYEPYCGLYAMHAALHSLGIEATLDEISIPEYLSGSDGGSTALDLICIAEKHGAHAWFRSGMSISDLRTATSPVILHTAAPIAESSYYHWILFLGMDGNQIRVYDPPRTFYTISSAELLSQWDGIGVGVEAIDTQRAQQSVLGHMDLELILGLQLVLVLGMAVSRFALASRYQLIGILLVALTASLAWHTCVDFGFLRNAYARGTVATRFTSTAFPVVTTEQFRQLVGNAHVTIIDAREPNEFEKSHVPTAINIPIHITHGSLRDTLAKIPVENRIVVYCASERCGWSDVVARLFPSRGFRDVSIFRGGMAAWLAQETSPLPPT